MTTRTKRFDKIQGPQTVISGSKKNKVLILNDTLQIHHSNVAADSDGTHFYNANLFIRDIGTDSTFRPINCKNSNLYFNTQQLITNSSLVSEINDAYYPIDASTQLTVSNIAVLGQPIGNHYGYINMTTTQGDGGVGIRYNHDNTMIEFKNNAAGNWEAVESNDLYELRDVEFSGLANNQLMQYNSTTSKWNNKTNAILPGTITLGGNLIVGSHSIVDSSNDELINFASDTLPVNYITVKNANTNVPVLLYSEGSDTNIGLTLKSKGAGDIKLDCNTGDLEISATNIYLTAATSIQTTGYYITSTETQETGSWTAGEANSIALTPTNAVFVINMTGKANGTYYSTLATGQDGQNLNIMFDKDASSIIETRIDFGASNLSTGGGYAQTLKFTQSGQSASLVYIGNGVNKWAVKNSGADVDNSEGGDLSGNQNNTISIYDSSTQSGWTAGSGNAITIGVDGSIMYFNLTGFSAGDYYATIGSSSTGKHMNLVFYRGATSGVDLFIDFGADNLLISTGTARYIQFDGNGQSVSVIYIANGLDKWQQLNTGGKDTRVIGLPVEELPIVP